MPSHLNPFAALTREITDTVLADHRAKRLAELRMKRLVAAYRELMDDPRYKAVRGELTTIMGEQLRSLVKTASVCPRCAPRAERITLLQEVIAAPLETIWFEREQPLGDDETDPDAFDAS